jgi:hypothetical protein
MNITICPIDYKVWRLIDKRRIHCWGGLRLQMFEGALLERLQNKFPNRKFKLVFHADGGDDNCYIS